MKFDIALSTMKWMDNVIYQYFLHLPNAFWIYESNIMCIFWK